ncbi:hypothetical protein D3C81_1341180 [compost metagenome]
MHGDGFVVEQHRGDAARAFLLFRPARTRIQARLLEVLALVRVDHIVDRHTARIGEDDAVTRFAHHGVQARQALARGAQKIFFRLLDGAQFGARQDTRPRGGRGIEPVVVERTPVRRRQPGRIGAWIDDAAGDQVTHAVDMAGLADVGHGALQCLVSVFYGVFVFSTKRGAAHPALQHGARLRRSSQRVARTIGCRRTR